MLIPIGLPFRFARSFFRSQADLEAEIVALRQQLIVAMRRAPKQLAINNTDRLILTGLCRVWPRLLGSMVIVQPARRSSAGIEQVTGARDFLQEWVEFIPSGRDGP